MSAMSESAQTRCARHCCGSSVQPQRDRLSEHVFFRLLEALVSLGINETNAVDEHVAVHRQALAAHSDSKVEETRLINEPLSNGRSVLRLQMNKLPEVKKRRFQ